MIAVREEPNSHLEFTNLLSLSPWGRPVLVVSQSFQDLIKVAQKLESAVQPVIGLAFDPSAMRDADHDAVSMLSSLEAHSTFTNESKWAGVYRDVVDG